MATPQKDSNNMSISQTEAADMGLALKELPSPHQQEWQLTDVLMETLSETLQSHTTVADNTDNNEWRRRLELNSSNQTKLTKKTVVENILT